MNNDLENKLTDLEREIVRLEHCVKAYRELDRERAQIEATFFVVGLMIGAPTGFYLAGAL